MSGSLLLTGCGTANSESTGTQAEEETKPAAQAETSVDPGDADTAESGTDDADETKDEKNEKDTAADTRTVETDAPQINGLTYESTLKLDYAECYDVHYYKDGYALIDVHDSARYLIVPESQEAPEGIDEDIIILKEPLDKIYLAATSAMALFDSLDELDSIRMSGTAKSGWYIDHAVEAMESGDILFAGKYSEPDYEMLVGENCNLAIESTMIQHVPKVQEMIETLGIPVFIDRSSYESHPLGRTEWIKLYGVMTGKEAEAETFFNKQTEVITELKDFPNTEKKVAFFYVNTDGSVVVRKSSDYVPRMIEIAGGRYAFDDLEDDESSRSSVQMSMEEFYATAVDADYLVYNATIDSPISSMEELLAKSDLFEDFKAVKEGNVWSTGKYLYQATDIVGNLITDLHLMLTDGDTSNMTFISKIE
ncbi:MAG: ABC transporter substrate-binding protein [Clostridia bacterium]|nr:ABC transporter substrate-binding protein [Clostridia bacterium]NCC44503.1 ABC transporter substrate-binding protein [Clostridia bacterium]